MPNRYDCGNSAQEGYMPGDVQIAFRGMETSPSVEARVRRRAEELQRPWAEPRSGGHPRALRASSDISAGLITFRRKSGR